MQENNQQEPTPLEPPEEPAPKTKEEIEWEEQLAKRLAELRKRDPFIYR